jgi:hypothetical protein
MKRYKLIVLIGGGFTQTFDVVADCFHTTTNNSTSSGYYSFYDNTKFVASYPIDRTIITKIEDI